MNNALSLQTFRQVIGCAKVCETLGNHKHFNE